jgi:ribonuclease E
MTLHQQTSELMLIDSSGSDLRIAVVDKHNMLTDLFLDSDNSYSIRNSIYLGTITRVEHSLQAAFVEYGGDKNGFLPFSEIHPDYYHIPLQDKKSMYEKIKNKKSPQEIESGEEEEQFSANEGGDEDQEVFYQFHKHYNIQEVIKRGQNVLVQVYRDSRGNKGVSLTTYISLAGRYCVFMPNSPSANEVGISKKISNIAQRKKISKVASGFKIGQGMRLVVRTAGGDAAEESLKKDYEYLAMLWNKIREKTLSSKVPALIHQDTSLIRQVFRDSYAPTIKRIIVHGERMQEVKEACSDFLHNMRVKILDYKDKVPLFSKYGIEKQISELMQERVDLPSGGYLVINQTEALIAIDVNSGRSTGEGSIEETAFQTNAEAAVEVARQLRLRELGGLIVIDFIDMMSLKNKKEIETILKRAFDADKAKIHFTRISMFGLLECSRQRIRPSIYEAMTVACPECAGTGIVRTDIFVANSIIRFLKGSLKNIKNKEVKIYVSEKIGNIYTEDFSREIQKIEQSHGIKVSLIKEPSFSRDAFSIKDVRGDGEVVIAKSEGAMSGMEKVRENFFFKKRSGDFDKKRTGSKPFKRGAVKDGFLGFVHKIFS